MTRMPNTIAQPSGTVSRRARFLLVLGFVFFLLGWSGVGFSLESQRCAHADGMASMHGSGFCAWLCTVHGQDLTVRLPEWPAILFGIDVALDASAGDVRTSFLRAFESRGPPIAAAQTTVLT
jgi:hypothetical protein